MRYYTDCKCSYERFPKLQVMKPLKLGTPFEFPLDHHWLRTCEENSMLLLKRSQNYTYLPSRFPVLSSATQNTYLEFRAVSSYKHFAYTEAGVCW